MADIKPGWNKVGSEFILYDNNLVEKKRQSTDPKPKASPPKSGVVNRIEKIDSSSNGEVPLLIEPYAYGTDKLHHSKYDKAQWRKWAEETGFKPKSKTVSGQNLEFQKHLLEDPQFKDKVRSIHQDLGMPYAGHPEDAYLGERWDKIMEKLTEKKEEPPVEDKTIKKNEEVKTEGERNPFETNTPTNYQLPENSPWWLQDIIKTAGSAADLARIKRYMPWQATPQVRLPEATFYDPTRELAANAEMANMAMQNSQAFTSPQQQAAANSVAQGQAAKNAADIMGRYNNLNVGLANQLSQEQTGIMNQASLNKANLDTQLWDKYNVLNQQFDNKAQARQALRQSYIDAITNRANTANLNSLYPEYAVNPMNGGKVYFRPDPNKIKATQKEDFKTKFREALDLTGDAKTALRYLELQSTGKLPSDNEIPGYPGSGE